ncbi:MAG: IS3 family transposase [Clostridia bacterium]|nr:IS3 family transposase [Clostridia bacterium]
MECIFLWRKIESVNAFIDDLKRYVHYYNNGRISIKLKVMSPVQYRTHSM